MKSSRLAQRYERNRANAAITLTTPSAGARRMPAKARCV
jgi:hypothetical protein